MSTCHCGEEAVKELRFPAAEEFKGSGETWTPVCADHYREHLENAREVNAIEVDKFDGAYGLVEWKEREPTELGHTCATCGACWESINEKTASEVRKAAKVNGQGPFCDLCRHLLMAKTFAEAAGVDLTEHYRKHFS